MSWSTHTTITADLGHPQERGRNLLWCATFQLAWDRARELVGEDLRLSGDPPLARALNRTAVGREDVDEASCVAGAGFGPAFLESLRSEVKLKFGDDPLLPAALPAEAMLAYGSLRKSLRFEPKLASRDRKLLFGTGNDRVPVRSFGVWSEGSSYEEWSARAASVRVLHYGGKADFVVELLTSSSEDRLLVARRAAGATLESTISGALAQGLASEDASLGNDEVLEVPAVNFDLTRAYGEINGRAIENTLLASLDLALQRIRFDLDEKGARLESEASFVVLSRGRSPPRSFRCDGPFLVLLMRRSAQRPYLACWIEHPELLLRSETR
jgi:hypothetical protein